MLGWKYVAAEEEAQRYKVGKFILETKRVVRCVAWEGADEDTEEQDDAEREIGGSGSGSGSAAKAGDEIEFDSQDEDECEDLFAGVWDRRVVAKRRREKERAWGKA